MSSMNIYPSYRVLDTCMGLGYTAIAAGRQIQKKPGDGGSVVTFEYDLASIEMSSYNPWSQQLFDGSLPITIRQGDACELISDYYDEPFDVIIHDPPAKALCRKDLYR